MDLRVLLAGIAVVLAGGLAKRADHIREMVRPRPRVSGVIGSYSHEEIREKNLYEQVAKETLGNGFYFWGVHVILIFFLWPLALACLVLLVLFSNIWGFAEEIAGRFRNPSTQQD